MTSGQQVITLWFITAADPRAVLALEPPADRGYARKLLAQLNPAWPLTHIGDFDMNRSAPPGDGEFYIGGYPGLTVIRTVLPEVPSDWSLSAVDSLPAPCSSLISMISAPDLLVTVHTPGDTDGLGGFAHWSGGRLTRCFYANRKRIIEDTGVPLPDEAAFWEGDTEAPAARGIELPFRPTEMAAAAIAHWLGFQVSDEIDIPVAAFAIDGRPDVRNSAETSTTDSVQPDQGHINDPGKSRHLAESPTITPASDAQYDDYSEHSDTEAETRSTAELLKGAAGSIVHAVGTGMQWIRTRTHRIGDEVRRRARNTGR